MARFATGKRSRAMCPVCGHESAYKRLKRRWDGLWTCPECWDQKHEQLTPVRHIHDPQALHHPWPDRDQDDDGDLDTHPDQGKELHEVFPSGYFHHGDVS